MIIPNLHQKPNEIFKRLSDLYRLPEEEAVTLLLNEINYSDEMAATIERRAASIITSVRAGDTKLTPLESFLRKYNLNSEQGLALMALAESLLRIGDSKTAYALIKDKLGDVRFDEDSREDESFLVKSSEIAFELATKLLALGGEDKSIIKKGVSAAAKPFIFQAVEKSIKLLSKNFILGEDIDAALRRSHKKEFTDYLFSFDMLGEAAKTKADAENYYRAYLKAIYALGKHEGTRPIHDSPGISVKLSALHPRYEHTQTEKVLEEIVPKVAELCRQARLENISLIIDAEEADKLVLSLDIIERVLTTTDLNGWDGLGLAIQAYHKCAPAAIDWVTQQSIRFNRQFIVRLVKGAYWDTEIKLSQEQGLSDYPVYTRKFSTDVSYLLCAQKMFAAGKHIYPAFGTHNAYTIAAIQEMAEGRPYEFQRLHGMGDEIYNHLLKNYKDKIKVRIYAPVGDIPELLPYLVRRLLENGANSSFVNHIFNDEVPVHDLIQNPIEQLKAAETKRHKNIPLPKDIYRHAGEPRSNSKGIDLADHLRLKPAADAVNNYIQTLGAGFVGRSIINGKEIDGEEKNVMDPSDHRRLIGVVQKVGAAQVDLALNAASKGFIDWSQTDAETRAKALDKAAKLIDSHKTEFIGLIIREAGRTIEDAISEIRETIDFCRYYALQARQKFSASIKLPGPTGETNELTLNGRGVFVCISPWNFPLAIFVGQIAAALAAGNTVIAKPAENTSLIAYKTVKLLHEAGIPEDVLHLIIGDGANVGAPLTSDLRVAGIALTGSTATAHRIHLTLAERGGPIIPFIAETGGQNACIVDSSALSEQVVRDVIMGAFRSAGQRCSATRVLFLQNEIADKVITMLTGAMEEIQVGDPLKLATDVGPVISMHAATELSSHVAAMHSQARVLKQSHLPVEAVYGNFVAPTAIEINDLSLLEGEVFGPVLHIIRYSGSHLDKVCNAINKTGFGLTLGIHSRVDSNIDYIRRHVRAGNMYVNRSQIGAVVGSQPFGGEGLSGTGFKAGGPHYLLRFATERTFCVNTTAAGGNASLICLGE